MSTQPDGKDEGLDTYSQRLEQKLRAMRLHGDFPGIHADLPSDMRQRQRLLQERVSEAIRSGRFWEIVKAEYARDYGSLFDGLHRAEQLVDEVFHAHGHAAAPANANLAGDDESGPDDAA